MKNYIKKPIVIQGMQWDGTEKQFNEVVEMINAYFKSEKSTNNNYKYPYSFADSIYGLIIQGPDKDFIINKGDYMKLGELFVPK